jgi:hypothetical protein
MRLAAPFWLHEGGRTVAGNRSTHDLLTPQHQAELRREYWLERAAWIGMGLILLSASLGAFGPGLLSMRRAATPDGSLSVEYSAIERYHAPGVLVLRATSERPDRSVQIALSRTLADRTKLVQVTPAPDRVETHEGAIVLTFRSSALADNSPMRYRYEHEHFGPLAFEVGLVGGQSVRVQQFVLP